MLQNDFVELQYYVSVLGSVEKWKWVCYSPLNCHLSQQKFNRLISQIDKLRKVAKHIIRRNRGESAEELKEKG